MSKEIKSVTDIFLEEQEWVPGTKAPFIIWAGLAGTILVTAGITFWIFQHNKRR